MFKAFNNFFNKYLIKKIISSILIVNYIGFNNYSKNINSFSLNDFHKLIYNKHIIS